MGAALGCSCDTAQQDKEQEISLMQPIAKADRTQGVHHSAVSPDDSEIMAQADMGASQIDNPSKDQETSNKEEEKPAPIEDVPYFPPDEVCHDSVNDLEVIHQDNPTPNK